MGEQYSQPAAPAEKSGPRQKTARICYGRLAATMWGCLAVALIAACTDQTAEKPALVEVANVTLASPDEDFGGLSGLEITADGSHAYVITDRGRLFEFELQRTDDGHVSNLSLVSKIQVNKSNKDYILDTEGLVLNPKGGFFISLENPPRVAKLNAGETDLKLLPRPPQDAIKRNNRGFEALAIDAEGLLYTFPETLPTGWTDFPIYVFENDQWKTKGTLPEAEDFFIVGADFGPNDTLFLLERSFSPLGFRTRVSRVDFSQSPVRQSVILNTRLGKYDNLEGISVWLDASGTTRVTMVSDDNFLAVQQQQLVEFILKE